MNEILRQDVILELIALDDDGSKSTLKELISMFTESSKLRMQELVSLGDEQPPQTIRKIAHSLRSSSLNLGSVAFAESLVKIENIKAADFHRLREFIQEAQIHYLQFMEKLQALI